MTSEHAVAPAESRLLLDLFVAHLRKNLEGEIIKALRPEIEKQIDAVVAELNPVITKHFDVQCHGVVHHITVGKRC